MFMVAEVEEEVEGRTVVIVERVSVVRLGVLEDEPDD